MPKHALLKAIKHRSHAAQACIIVPIHCASALHTDAHVPAIDDCCLHSRSGHMRMSPVRLLLRVCVYCVRNMRGDFSACVVALVRDMTLPANETLQHGRSGAHLFGMTAAACGANFKTERYAAIRKVPFAPNTATVIIEAKDSGRCTTLSWSGRARPSRAHRLRTPRVNAHGAARARDAVAVARDRMRGGEI